MPHMAYHPPLIFHVLLKSRKSKAQLYHIKVMGLNFQDIIVSNQKDISQ